MKRMILFATALSFSIFTLPYVNAQHPANGPQPASALTQKLGAKEITFVAINRTKRFSDDFFEFTPKEGEEIALVRLVVKFTETDRGITFKCSELELEDVSGNKYNCDARYTLSTETSRPQRPYLPELPFFVPKGTRFKIFRMGSLSFNIERLEKEGPPARLTAANDPLSGEWDGTLTINDRITPQILKLSLNGSNVTGEMVSGTNTWNISKGTWAYNELFITFETPQAQHTMNATIEGDMLNGYVLLNKQFSATFKAKKKK